MHYCSTDWLPGLQELFARYGMEVVMVPAQETIPGSFWGDEEAGIIANRLYVRTDTPIHSAFHEACHYICMDSARRAVLDTNAEGDYAEENGVCYLQILLADYLASFDRQRMQADMDSWGYSFRLGSTKAWFELDAEDAQAWLRSAGLIDDKDKPLWTLRQ